MGGGVRRAGFAVVAAGRGLPRGGLRIIAVGRAGHGPEAALFARYAARLRPTPSLVECADGHGSPAEIRRREAIAILAALPADAVLLALDRNGDAPSSAAFAVLLDRLVGTARTVAFAIGGAEGLDPSVLARATTTLSFGPQTWPHLLARAMLAEQLWRARSITTGHPYHRA